MDNIPEIYQGCAHPQAVWFETHWRPIIIQLQRQNTELQQSHAELKAKLDKAISGLKSIKAKSHSWVIKQDSVYIEKPIHDSYRELARQTLAEIGEV